MIHPTSNFLIWMMIERNVEKMKKKKKFNDSTIQQFNRYVCSCTLRVIF